MLHVFCLNWNGENLLNTLLISLLENLKNISQDYSIHIRDNGSTDNSINIIKKYSINLYSIAHNRDSFSEGMNFLLKETKPDDEDYILLLNNDINFISNNNLNKMIKLQQKTKAGMVGAKLFYPNKLLSHYGIIFSHKYNTLPWNFKSGEKTSKYDNNNRKFQAVTAACCLVTGHALKKANGFDPEYKWSFEDVDLALNISKIQKLPIVCCGDTNIIHETSISLKKNPVNKLFLNHNVKRFRNKWNNKYIIDHELYLNNKNYGLL